jgi:adenine-specific DNA-methyltransferase
MASLYFKGKSVVWNHHLSVPYHTLKKDNKKSLKGKNEEENLIIEGDNLLALKALLPKYQGKVKCIYIDPPYNTGNENWIYSDSVNSPLIKDWIGTTVGKDDLTRHDKWLCMMTPRLKLLQELLRNDGIIFVSIEDNEVSHLRQLMDEIFGEDNFISEIIWRKRDSQANLKKNIVRVSEYILTYQKTDAFQMNLLPPSEKLFSNPDNDPKGSWSSQPLANSEKSTNKRYAYKFKNGVVLKKKWIVSLEEMQRLDKNDLLYWPKSKNGKLGIPRRKFYFSENNGNKPNSLWVDTEFYGNTEEAGNEINEIFGNKEIFDTPKPTKLIKRIIQLSTNKEDIILDSFAGSGTTADAVLQLNKEDGGNRKFIMVEMENYANTITAERVRRIIRRDKMGIGFTYNKLGPSIDADSILSGKLPEYKEFAKYVFYLATGKNHPDDKKIKEKEYFVGKLGSESIYLIYEKNLDALKKLAITLDWVEKINKKDSNKKIVYAPACFLDEENLEKFNIQFIGIPYNLFEKR